MTERQVRFERGMSRPGAGYAFALLILFICTPPLGSEDVKVTTYYPAPSGVYTKMITAGETYLTRDGGNLVIGGMTPVSVLPGDLTVRDGMFFGTGVSPYGMNASGQVNLSNSIVGDLVAGGAATTLHFGAASNGDGNRAFVFRLGASSLASIRHGTGSNDAGTGKQMYALGSFTTTGSPDIAEYAMAEAGVEAADVVSVSETALTVPGPGGERFQLRKSRAPYEAALGVVADGTSAFQIQSHMGDIDKLHPGKPLVLAGRVPVKVTAENGPIRIGDPLASSSKPGYAMKALAPGPTIGIALNDFDGAEGTVLCAVRGGEQGGGAALRGLQDDNRRLRERLEALEKRLPHD